MNLFARFKSLPVPTRRLLSIGIILGLVVGLPLFVWAIVSQKFLINQKASTTTIPLNIQESFTGNGALDSTKWNWSGVNGSSSSLESDKLKMIIPAGSVNLGSRIAGSDVVTFPLVNQMPITITGPFDVSVDIDSVTSSVSAGLKFGAGVIIQRTGGSNLIQVLTSATNTIYTVVESFQLPENTGSVRVRLLRTDQNIQAFYDIGTGYVLLATITDTGYVTASDLAPGLILQNEAPNYIQGSALFDNYSLTANQVIQIEETPTPSPSPSASPSVSPSPSGSPSATPTPTPPPTVNCGGTCGNNYGCGAGLTCYNGECRNPACVVSTNCSCGTPTPTPTPSPTVRPISIRFKFEGVNADSANLAKVTVRFVSRVLDNSLGYTTPPIEAQYVGNGVYTLNFGMWSNTIPAGNDYSIVLKGEKHLGVKFCSPNGQTTHCSGSIVGNITLPADPTSLVSLDFTGVPLIPGDISPQDGVANMNDFAKISALLVKPHSELTAEDLLVGDLNYDGYVNILDAFLMRQTLQTRYDEN